MQAALMLSFKGSTLSEQVTCFQEAELNLNLPVGRTDIVSPDEIFHIRDVDVYIERGQNILCVGSGTGLEEFEIPGIFKPFVKEVLYQRTHGQLVGDVLDSVEFERVVVVHYEAYQTIHFEGEFLLNVAYATRAQYEEI
jgi:hypothetical protein